MKTTQEILTTAKQESMRPIPTLTQRNKALELMAQAIEHHTDTILKANAEDMEKAKNVISSVMLDRLFLDKERIQKMADGVRSLVPLEDPVGKVLEETTRPNGLNIRKVHVPFGVLAVIYESRPNVTSDAAALIIKSGNTAVLRSGKDAWNSAKAITDAMREGLKNCGLNPDRLQLIEDVTRQSSTDLMRAEGLVDLLIPRGGAGLIKAVVENATVPVIETGTGICHIFVDESADQAKALDIIENAKCSRPSVCNAEEVLLVHENIAEEFLPKLKQRLVDDRKILGKTPVELRLDDVAQTYIEGTPATPQDFHTEFLDYILAVKVVTNTSEAIQHIGAHSTHHSEAILTKNGANAEMFTTLIDSAALYVNASTRFTDGGEFGMGCEMGISTQKLHARGPMGLNELCTTKFIIQGNGQIR